MSTTIATGRFDKVPPYRPAGLDSWGSQQVWADAELELQRSASAWLRSTDAMLDQVAAKYNKDGWDEPGSRAVSRLTILTAKAIIAAIFEDLPPGIPPPDIGPEPDGEISVDWNIDAKRIFSFSVGDHDKINFAGRFTNGQSRHGCLQFDRDSRLDSSDSIRELSQHIVRLYRQATVQRAA